MPEDFADQTLIWCERECREVDLKRCCIHNSLKLQQKFMCVDKESRDLGMLDLVSHPLWEKRAKEV